MLAFVEGIVTQAAGEGRVILKVGDFGVTAEMVPREAHSLRYGEKVRLHTRLLLNAQDGKLTCFGFLDEISRDVFVLLLKSPGVGPKAALSLLEIGTARLLRAIEEGQVATLTSVQGVGTKTAQRLVLELKGKFTDIMSKLPEADIPTAPQREITQALVGLGFRESEVLAALNALHSEGIDLTAAPLEELLRVVLERLRR